MIYQMYCQIGIWNIMSKKSSTNCGLAGAAEAMRNFEKTIWMRSWFQLLKQFGLHSEMCPHLFHAIQSELSNQHLVQHSPHFSAPPAKFLNSPTDKSPTNVLLSRVNQFSWVKSLLNGVVKKSEQIPEQLFQAESNCYVFKTRGHRNSWQWLILWFT